MPAINNLPSTLFVWRDIHAVNFDFNSPFTIRLTDIPLLSIEFVLRIIPKKRMVAIGTWQDKPVIAKLFFDSTRAKQHAEKDVAGIKILQANNIPTPFLHYQGMSEDHRICLLIFERIFDAENLARVWETNKHDLNHLLPILKSMITELATQHVLGILQHDIHFKNFLLADKRIYTLDGAHIELFPPLLPKTPSVQNLALFLAQLGFGFEHLQKELFQLYFQLRGWQIKHEDYHELFYLINKRNHKRWSQYEKKIFRNSSDFARFNHMPLSGIYNRSYQSPAFLQLLKDPDAIFNQYGTRLLKSGRSATVAKIMIDNRALVIKRYNMKNIWHRVRRSMRLTRAYLSWRLAQKCILLGISTAKPVAFIENKYFGLKSKSYFISEFVSGEHAGDFFKKNLSENELNTMIVRMSHLLKNIAKLEITHGDLKLSNILIDNHHYPVLIDLDGVIEHSSFLGLQATFQQDVKRFLKNFDDHSVLRNKFQEIL